MENSRETWFSKLPGVSDVALPEAVSLPLFGFTQLSGEIKHRGLIPLLPQAAHSGKEFYVILPNNPFLRQPRSLLPLDQQICKYLHVFKSLFSLSFLLPLALKETYCF